jgi:hypothetical protein
MKLTWLQARMAHQQDSYENLPLLQIPIVGAVCGATLFMFYISWESVKTVEIEMF